MVGQPMEVCTMMPTSPQLLGTDLSARSLDNIGLAGFSYNFNSISGDSNPLAVSLEALTNSAENFTSFVMKALFFTFPSILKSMSTAFCPPLFWEANLFLVPSEKGKLIRNTRQKFGEVAINMWNEAKAGGKAEGNTLMDSMSKPFLPLARLWP